MSLPPDDRQHHDRTSRSAHGPQHAAPTGGGSVPATAGVTPGSTFAPISFRPAVDVDAVQARLKQLGQTRSTDALAERAELLRLLGRLDESLAVAEEVFRLTMFTGERADAVSARIRRAHVLHDLGRHERAVTESAMARDTATIEEWPELEGAAAEIEGWSLFELSRFEEARVALGRAYEAFRVAGAPAERTQALRAAIDAALQASTKQPSAELVDPQRAAREAAARTDEPVEQPRRTVLGAPDAARTEHHDDRPARRPLFGRRDRADAEQDTARRGPDAARRAPDEQEPPRGAHLRDGIRRDPDDTPDDRPRGGLWNRGGSPRDGGDRGR
jgi:tetratricopeptide (TPR) repeat protein